ncbi:MAG: hypothetical protein GF410_03810 [Chitinivibrionales bacterium]|nr:hypothetical protein [Chitinivibrionales bacterium]
MKNALLPALAACCIAVLPARAQSFGRVEETKSNSDAYYYHVQPGSRTVQVHVLGAARYPGLYELTEGTDLKQLLALCGGPDFERRYFIHRQKTTVRLYRPGGSDKKLVYEARMEQAVTDNETKNVLRDGDVLTIEVVERRRFDWRDILTIVNVVNTIVLIALAVR